MRVVNGVLQKNRVLPGIYGPIEIGSGRDDLLKKRVERQAEGRKRQWKDKRRNGVVHVGPKKAGIGIGALGLGEGLEKGGGVGVERGHGEGGRSEVKRARVVRSIDAVVQEEETRPFPEGGAELDGGVHRTDAEGEGVRDDIHGGGSLELGEEKGEGSEKREQIDRGAKRRGVASRLV